MAGAFARMPYWVLVSGLMGIIVVVVCVIIWAISCISSGEFVYPWPAWMLIPLVLGLVGRRRNR